MPASKARITIIIATYNAATTLERCLNSIYSQDFSDWELIVIDGGSSDQTTSILERHSAQIVYWHSRKDEGIYDAWNQGITHASGDYIGFLGADDYFAHESAMSMLISGIGSADYDLVSSKGKFLIDGGGQHIIGNPWSHRKLGKRITVCHPGLLHHRSLFERFGVFDINYRIVGDYEFLLRLDAEIKAAHVDSVTICISDGGISRSRYSEMLKEKRRAQSLCPRVGKFKATCYYYEKLCKIPIARLLGLSY